AAGGTRTASGRSSPGWTARPGRRSGGRRPWEGSPRSRRAVRPRRIETERSPMRLVRAVVPLLVAALAGPPVRLGAQTQEPQPPPTPPAADVPTFGIGTAAVTLDVVVRDKKGHAVRDLQARDFEVFEDGGKQTIDSFNVFGSRTPPPELAQKPAAPAAETANAAAAPAALTAPSAPAGGEEDRPQVIAFVFDRLTAQARDTAHKASLVYVEKGHVEGDLVGIFTIDLALHTVQPFTPELGLIRAGLERAVSQGNTSFSA